MKKGIIGKKIGMTQIFDARLYGCKSKADHQS